MSIKNAARAFAGTLIMTICAFGQFTPNLTATTTSHLAPVGLGLMESAQVIVANNAANPSKGTPASCAGSVSFYDASGAIIGTATSFTLTSGQIEQVSLPAATVGAASPRTLIRAVVSLTTTFTAFAPCSLSYSLVTYDVATGATHAIVTDSGIASIVSPLLGLL